MNLSNLFSNAGLFIKKNSPYILMIFGGVSVTAGTVLVAKKAHNAKNTVDKRAYVKIEETHEFADGETTKQHNAKLRKTYASVALDYTKYYCAPVLLVSGGLACMVSATLIQTKRLKVMSAAYTALASAFNTYRERVRNELGDQKESDLFNGVTRDKDGKIESVEPLIKEEYNCETFSRLFGDGNTPFWDKNTRICVNHLKGAEGTCNAILRERGYITLNEVYDELGFSHSEQGMYLGWRFKYGDPVYGATYVDLGFCGPKHKDYCEELEHEWNKEFWINITPPHSLFGKMPKEKSRTDEEKFAILKKRRFMHE